MQIRTIWVNERVRNQNIRVGCNTNYVSLCPKITASFATLCYPCTSLYTLNFIYLSFTQRFFQYRPLPHHDRTEEASSKLAGPSKSYLLADKELLYLLESTHLSHVAMTEPTSRSDNIASLSRSCESEWRLPMFCKGV